MADVSTTRMDEYGLEWLRRFFTSIPHLTFSLEKTSTVFALDDKLYVQSLAFWLSVLGLAAFACLAIVITLYCVYCCITPPLKRKPLSGFQWASACFIFFSCASLCFVLYGNQLVCSGVSQLVKCANSHISALSNLQNQSDAFRHTLDPNLVMVIENASNYGDEIDVSETFAYNSYVKMAVSTLKLGEKALDDMYSALPTTNGAVFKFDVSKLENYNYIGWLGVLVASGWSFVVLISLLFSLLCAFSRTCLVFCSVLGFSVIVLLWAIAGLAFSGSIALSDMSSSRSSVFQQVLTSQLAEKSDIVEYLTVCNRSSGFFEKSSELTGAIPIANASMSELRKLLLTEFPENSADINEKWELWTSKMNMAWSSMSSFQSYLGCEPVKVNYDLAQYALYHDTLLGAAWLCLGASVGAIFSFIAVIIGACAFRHFESRLRIRSPNRNNNESNIRASSVYAFNARSTSYGDNSPETVPLRFQESEPRDMAPPDVRT